jgi:hypothetical protein
MYIEERYLERLFTKYEISGSDGSVHVHSNRLGCFVLLSDK